MLLYYDCHHSHCGCHFRNCIADYIFESLHIARGFGFPSGSALCKLKSMLNIAFPSFIKYSIVFLLLSLYRGKAFKVCSRSSEMSWAIYENITASTSGEIEVRMEIERARNDPAHAWPFRGYRALQFLVLKYPLQFIHKCIALVCFTYGKQAFSYYASIL